MSEKQTICKHCDGPIQQSPTAGNSWVHSDGWQRRLHNCPVDPYGFHAEPVGTPCSDHPANPCNGARGITVQSSHPFTQTEHDPEVNT